MNSPSQTRQRGVFAPVVTPFREDLSIDLGRFLTHCQTLVADGCGLAVFGTNSEATSVSNSDRMRALHWLIDQGIPPNMLMPGTGCCSLDDTVALTKHALAIGVKSALMLPPFFYKNLSEDGLFAYFSSVIERVESDHLAVYLYHIPQFTQVPITAGLIERLLAKYPRNVAGLKDSSGDWQNTSTMLNRFAKQGFDVFCASEVFLPDTMALGGAGCISATANVNGKNLAKAFALASSPELVTHMEGVKAVRAEFQSRPMIGAMKYFLAHQYDEPGWKRVRPPLDALNDADGQALLDRLRTVGMSVR